MSLKPHLPLKPTTSQPILVFPSPWPLSVRFRLSPLPLQTLRAGTPFHLPRLPPSQGSLPHKPLHPPRLLRPLKPPIEEDIPRPEIDQKEPRGLEP